MNPKTGEKPAFEAAVAAGVERRPERASSKRLPSLTPQPSTHGAHMLE